MNSDPECRRGVYFALAAYIFWGLVPVYFKALAGVSSFEVLAHRILWSVVFLLFLIGFSRRRNELVPLFLRPRLLLALTASALVVSVNWFVFIWAVAQGRILETSLGYFINPLVSVFLGMLFLGERLRPGQWLAVALAAVAVIYQILLLGQFPLIALTLAFSFGTYGLLRKKIPVGPILGLFIETLLLLPLAAGYLLWLNHSDRLQFGHAGVETSLLLIGAGLVTSLPLLWFAAATRRLTLILMGLLQYLVPSISFIVAVYYYHEPIDLGRLTTFVIIWIALFLFSMEGWLVQRRSRLHPI